MSIRKQDVKVGQDVTLVSRGIRHCTYGEDKPWIDELVAGSTSFLRITKIGKKHLYGVHFYFEEEQRKEAHYEADHNLDEYIIFDGVREDLKIQHVQFRRDYDEHEKRRTSKHYELERELNDQLRAKMDEWDRDNPRPKNGLVQSLSTI